MESEQRGGHRGRARQMATDGWISPLESLDGAPPPRHSAWTSQRDYSRASSEHKLRRQEKGRRERTKRHVSKASLVAPQTAGTGFRGQGCPLCLPCQHGAWPRNPSSWWRGCPFTCHISAWGGALRATFQASSVYPLHWQRAMGNICSDGHGSALGFGYLGFWCESSGSPRILTASAALRLLVSTEEQLANPLPALGGYCYCCYCCC